MNKFRQIILINGLLLALLGLSWLPFAGSEVSIAQAAELAGPQAVASLSSSTSITAATKTADPAGEVDAGAALTYTIVFTVDSPASRIVVTDDLPSEVVYRTGSMTGTPPLSITNIDENQNIWEVTNVGANSVISLSLQVTVTVPIEDGTIITNTAHISDQTKKVTITISNTVRSPALSLQKTGPAQALLGETIAYTLRFTNTGSLTATNVHITDTLPTGLEFVASSRMPSVTLTSTNKSTVAWTIPSLGVGQADEIILTATVNMTGTLTNSAEIATAEGVTATASVSLTAFTEQAIFYLPIMMNNFPELQLDIMVATDELFENRQIPLRYTISFEAKMPDSIRLEDITLVRIPANDEPNEVLIDDFDSLGINESHQGIHQYQLDSKLDSDSDWTDSQFMVTGVLDVGNNQSRKLSGKDALGNVNLANVILQTENTGGISQFELRDPATNRVVHKCPPLEGDSSEGHWCGVVPYSASYSLFVDPVNCDATSPDRTFVYQSLDVTRIIRCN